MRAARVVETHSAMLFFVGERVYKVKKPVSLGFLDFRSLDARRHACAEELRLNRRLAPDVYLDTYDVLDSAGTPVEAVLVMQRLPDHLALSELVRAGVDVRPHLLAVARRLAAFHAAAPTSAAVEQAGSPARLRRSWEEGLDQLAAWAGPSLEPSCVAQLRGLALRYLDGRAPLLERRRVTGCLRDGHGDLLAADVYCLPDGPRILDCLDFDPQLRYGDVLLDVAFLAMDLEDLGRPELAARFLSDYAEHSGMHWPSSLAHHYVAYRASVRSKVSFVRSAQGDLPAIAHGRLLAELAADHLHRGAVRLVLVGGLPGTGKSTVSARLAQASGWVLLRSDVVRKQQAGLAAEARAAASYGSGLYSAQRTSETYDVLLGRARTALSLGESVVLDASWSSADRRSAARQLARETCSDLVELRCVAPPDVTGSRLRERARGGIDASDADGAVAAQMAAGFDPWPEATELPTEQPTDRTADLAAALSGPW